MENMYYFGYGMNTNRSEMWHRCPRSTSVGKAVLKDYKFRFAYYADIVPHAGSKVHGVLWEISQECLDNLDVLEGYPIGYDRKIVKVECGGRQYDCWVYHMVNEPVEELPSKNYLGMVCEGYNQHGINTDQLFEAIMGVYRKKFDNKSVI